MFVGHVNDMPKIDMTPGGAKGAAKQVVVMRIMTLDVEGNSPQHSHDWPHINYVISGTGVLMMAGKEYPLTAGTCAYVPANVEHCFTNTGSENLEFICIVPIRGEA